MAAADLTTTRDNLEAIVAAQTTLWVAAGCPPDFSVDGESYQWTAWLQGKLDAIKALNELIARRAPFYVRSRLRG